jgi:hypothetical protein
MAGLLPICYTASNAFNYSSTSGVTCDHHSERVAELTFSHVTESLFIAEYSQ